MPFRILEFINHTHTPICRDARLSEKHKITCILRANLPYLSEKFKPRPFFGLFSCILTYYIAAFNFDITCCKCKFPNQKLDMNSLSSRIYYWETIIVLIPEFDTLNMVEGTIATANVIL